MAKYFVLFSILFSISSLADEPRCGRMTGIVFNHHDHAVQGLSGFWVKQPTYDIRVTRGMNEKLMKRLESLETLRGLFICLDEYEIIPKTYAGKRRLYAEVFSYRLWQFGNLARKFN